MARKKVRISQALMRGPKRKNAFVLHSENWMGNGEFMVHRSLIGDGSVANFKRVVNQQLAAAHKTGLPVRDGIKTDREVEGLADPRGQDIVEWPSTGVVQRGPKGMEVTILERGRSMRKITGRDAKAALATFYFTRLRPQKWWSADPSGPFMDDPNDPMILLSPTRI